MKNLQNLALLSAVIAFAGCESHKKSTINESGDEVVEIRTPSSDTTATESEATVIKSVEGIITEINMGKDGYTAKVETADKLIYFVTISHSNLKDPAQYKSSKVGDKIEVTGDYWQLGPDHQITVREIN